MKARWRLSNLARVLDAEVQNLASASSKSFKQLNVTTNPRSVTFMSAHRTPLMKAVRWRQRAFSSLLSLYKVSTFQSKLKICSSERKTRDDFLEESLDPLFPPCTFSPDCLNLKLILQGATSSPSCASVQRKTDLLSHQILVTSLPSFTSTFPNFSTTALT